MPFIYVVSAFGGDEGKAKVVKFMIGHYHAKGVARYGGGPNAGHTDMIGDQPFDLHQIPVGINVPRAHCFLTAGMVIEHESLRLEAERCLAIGAPDVWARIHIDPRANLILPHHLALDSGREETSGSRGSTKHGITPAYLAKIGRDGIRVGDLLNFNSSWQDRLEEQVGAANATLARYGRLEQFTSGKIRDELLAAANWLIPLIGDTSQMMMDISNSGGYIIGEGNQAMMLDVDHGWYPFVTSSHVTIGGVYSGLGLGPQDSDEIILVAKAYISFVGQRPFPGEMSEEEANRLREKTHEYGTTTGRPRRLGFFSLPILRYAILNNQPTSLTLTRLDGLGNAFFPDSAIRVVTGYRFRGKDYETWSPMITEPGEAEPIFSQYFKSWQISEPDARGMKSFDELPEAAHHFVEYLEEKIGRTFNFISVSPYGDQMIVR